MGNSILEKRGANYFGCERIDSSGKHHFNLVAIRGAGNLVFTNQKIYFKQWITQTEYTIPLEKIVKVEVKSWHNMKMKWPAKVLRIHFKDQDEIKILGVTVGGKISFRKGWQDNAYLWKGKIENAFTDYKNKTE